MTRRTRNNRPRDITPPHIDEPDYHNTNIYKPGAILGAAAIVVLIVVLAILFFQHKISLPEINGEIRWALVTIIAGIFFSIVTRFIVSELTKNNRAQLDRAAAIGLDPPPVPAWDPSPDLMSQAMIANVIYMALPNHTKNQAGTMLVTLMMWFIYLIICKALCNNPLARIIVAFISSAFTLFYVVFTLQPGG